jgi:hypothetical protein
VLIKVRRYTGSRAETIRTGGEKFPWERYSAAEHVTCFSIACCWPRCGVVRLVCREVVEADFCGLVTLHSRYLEAWVVVGSWLESGS